MNSKINIARGSHIIFGANLLVFLMIFIPIYVTSELNNIYYFIYRFGDYANYFYFVDYLEQIIHWIAPIFSAVLLTHRYANFGTKKTVFSAIRLSAANLVYTIPFYYLVAMSEGAYSTQALIWSVGTSLVYCLILFICSLILFLVIKTAVCFFVAKEEINTLPPKKKKEQAKQLLKENFKKANSYLSANFSESRALDFTSPATLGVFFASLLTFVFYLGVEIANTAAYLNEAAGTYRPEEIAYMLFRYIFLLIMLFLSHAVCNSIKNKSRYITEE